MLGTDGRLYDSDFDYDGDGKLNAYEYSVMDDLVFGHEDTCTSDETELEDDLLLKTMSENANWQRVDFLRAYGRLTLLLQIQMVARFF